MSLLRLALPLLLCACATADGDSQPEPTPDAKSVLPFVDAAPTTDGGRALDATPQTIDAAPVSIDADMSSGTLCDDNSECTIDTECCFIFCVTGSIEIGICVPD